MGPNQSLGGVQLGLARVAYQVVIWGRVARVPTAPEMKTMNTEAINFGISFNLKPSITYQTSILYLTGFYNLFDYNLS